MASRQEAMQQLLPAHILVVDDSPDDVRAIVQLLRAQNYQVSIANDARQALQRAVVLCPDLVLLDVHMPHMDGFTLCRLLRETEAVATTPIIFLTSAGSLNERLEGLQLGGVDYIIKPYSAEEVLARVRVHLQLQFRGLPTELGPLSSAQQDDELLLRAACRLIQQNLDQLPPLVELARKVGTYDKRLSRLFREHLNMTVFAYAREMRLRKSQELLSDSNMTVQQVATRVGFNSAANFTTAFRTRIGMTPTQYRQQAREE